MRPVLQQRGGGCTLGGMRVHEARLDLTRCGLCAMLVLGLLLSGCSTLGYVGHLGKGQLALLRQQQPVAQLLASPDTDPTLREQLLLLGAAREFASDHLLLPRNRSYTRYVALDREYVSWVVIAAPEFSLDPVPLCLPIAGCVPYRGYFDRGLAEQAADELAARGLDTWVGGVAAYSTLGWFADPLLSSMLRDGTETAVATVFHELAHQWLYVRDDTRFNESLASFVEQQGLREWRQGRGLAQVDASMQGHGTLFRSEVQSLIDRLQMLYASTLPDSAKRQAKAEAFDAFRNRYRGMSDEGVLSSRVKAWVDGQLNNAALQPQRLYDGWLPAFANLFRAAEGDWATFQTQVESLSRLPRDERDRRLAALTASAGDD